MQKRKPLLTLIMAFAITLSITAGTMLIAAGPSGFPLATNSGAIVADEDTKYVTIFEQDPITKLITATVQIQNNSETEELAIQAAAVSISFSEDVAPYSGWADGSFDQNLLFGAGKSVADAVEFEKYCTPLIYLGENDYDQPVYFNTSGSQYIERGNGGGVISTKISKQIGDSNPDLTIAPGHTADIMELYFMPINGTDTLDIEMFGYIHGYDAGELITLSPTIASESSILAAAQDHIQPVYTYTVSPESFKVHIKRPLPVRADEINRTVTGYDVNTMEWSYSESGPYSSGAPIVKDEAHTIYVRINGDAQYSGDDEVFGDYKKYADSVAQVEFDAFQYADYSSVDAAIQEAEELERAIYTTGSLAVVDTAVASVVRGLGEAQQAVVDGYATAIYAAISNLVVKAPVTSLRIDALPVETVSRNSTRKFSVILNQGASDENVVWFVTVTSYAEVSNDGTVTIKNLPGTVNLTASDKASGLSHTIILRIV